MIPKIIHYCWFGGKKIPQNLQNYIKTWKEYCPDYEIKCWNEENVDVNCNQFVKEAYESKNWAFVSDYIRLKIIYENGGIYLDTDVELLKGLDELINDDLFFAIQQNGCYVNTGLCFGASKGNKILKEMLEEYDKLKFDEEKKAELACPYIATNSLEKYGFSRTNENQILKENIKIYSSEYFDPISPDSNVNLISKNTFSIHHYSATWMTKRKVIKRKICNFIGQKNINKLKKILKRSTHE